MLIDGRAQPSGIRERGSDATLLLIFNGHHEGVGFTLPETVDGLEWHLLLDTSEGATRMPKVLPPGESVQLADRSLAAFVMQRTEAELNK
jgi:glycogen operon protein